MKKWILILCFLLLFTACGKQEAVSSPYDLEIEYGDSGVLAEKGTFLWEWNKEDGTVSSAEKAVEEPFTRLSEIPYINESKDKSFNLLFQVEPDSLEICYWTSADGYKQAVEVEKPKTKLTAPKDGAGYLYKVTAQWERDEKSLCGGSCAYYFRFLPEGSTGDQSQEMTLYRMVQLRPADLFGVVFINNLDGQQRTCTSTADRTAILDYLKTYLTTNFVPIDVPSAEADYVLRLAVTDGTQLTLAYGGEGQNTWIMLGGVPYEAEVMDLYSLWKSMEAQPVLLDDGSEDQYLQVSEEFPGADWGEEFAYGYLRQLDTEAVYDEIFWIEDAEQPNGYALDRGDLGRTLPVAGDCEYWILKNHAEPWCQVEQADLWQWAETTGWDVLFRLYTKDGQIIAICEQYVP